MISDGCQFEGCAADEEKWNNESNLVIEKLKHEHEIEKMREKYADSFETMSAVLTLLDLTSTFGNFLFAIAYDISLIACPNVCAPIALGLYQIGSIGVNSISTVAGIGWITQGIMQGTNDFEYYSNSGQSYISLSVSQDSIVSATTNLIGWGIKEPNVAFFLDGAVTAYDLAGLLDVMPINTNPTFTFSSSSGFTMNWFQK